MKTFVTTVYRIKTDKLKSGPVRLVMISDLHNVMLGHNNQNLYDKIKACNPDIIVIAGDLVLGKKEAPVQPAIHVLENIRKMAPVVFAPGNHEQRMNLFPAVYGNEFERLLHYMQKAGIHYLENQRMELKIRGERIVLYGLDIPPEFYWKKRKTNSMNSQSIRKWLGEPDANVCNVLLAHTPRFGDAYFEWDADLILSGHYHGGMVRLPLLGGVISPDFRLFPKYCWGRVQKGRQNMITGAGLGEHTVPIRIHNPRELVIADLYPS